MKTLFLSLFILFSFSVLSQTDSLVIDFDPFYPGGYGPCNYEEDGITYIQRIGETYETYVVADGWFWEDGRCLRQLYNGVPYGDFHSVSDNRTYICYKDGKPYSGPVNYENDFERLKGRCVDGKLQGRISTYYVTDNEVNWRWRGDLDKGQLYGLWVYWHEQKYAYFINHYELGNNHPVKTTVNYNSEQIERITEYDGKIITNELKFYESGDTLSKLVLVDRNELIYTYIEYHENGKVKSKGKKKGNDLYDPFMVKEIGDWKYYNEEGELIRTNTF